MDDTGNTIDMKKVNAFLIKAGSLGLDFSNLDLGDDEEMITVEQDGETFTIPKSQVQGR